MRDDELFLIRRHFRLGGHDIERRRLADIHFGFVDARELLRERERRLARLDGGARRDEIPVRALDVGRRVHEVLAEPRVGDVAIGAAGRQLQPRVVDEQIAHERL